MKEITEEANIYTLYSDNKPFYIGKTVVTNGDGKIKMGYLNSYHANPKLKKKVKAARNFKIRVLVRTSQEAKVWFNEKLKKHTEYLNKKYNLVNSKNVFGLNGYAYWKGKKKDKHTLKRLEESKYKPIVQFTNDGKFVREWKSAKHAAKHYRVYQLVNGSGASPIHHATSSKRKVWNNFVWYQRTKVIELYGKIPTQLEKLHFDVPSKRIKTLIVKCNSKGRVLDYYYTPKQAAEAHGTTAYFILQNLNKNVKFVNYYWKTDELR